MRLLSLQLRRALVNLTLSPAYTFCGLSGARLIWSESVGILRRCLHKPIAYPCLLNSNISGCGNCLILSSPNIHPGGPTSSIDIEHGYAI